MRQARFVLLPLIFCLSLTATILPVSAYDSFDFLEELLGIFDNKHYELGDTTQLEKFNAGLTDIQRNVKKSAGSVTVEMTLQGYDHMMCNNTLCWVREDTDYNDIMYKYWVSIKKDTTTREYDLGEVKVHNKTVTITNDTIELKLSMYIEYTIDKRKKRWINETEYEYYWESYDYNKSVVISDTIHKPDKFLLLETYDIRVIGNSTRKIVSNDLYGNSPFGIILKGVEESYANNVSEMYQNLTGVNVSLVQTDVNISIMWIKSNYTIEKQESRYIGRIIELQKPQIDNSGLAANIDFNEVKYVMGHRVNLTNASVMTPYGPKEVKMEVTKTIVYNKNDIEGIYMFFLALGIIFLILLIGIYNVPRIMEGII